ncbi:MAG: hypothetical protein JNK38_28765 [Acidobacteria bacterium]|nr:hypothetical protein [Acidobacteriota bacterium]
MTQDVRVGNLTFLGGEYQLTLLEGGKYRLGRNDFITLTGNYTVTGNLVEFASPATMDTCSGKGMYQWTLTGNRLTLTAATSRVDSCLERIVSLTSSPFFKQDPTNNLWKNIGPTGGAVYAVLVNDSKVYAGGDGGGVFLSADNGQSWKATRGIRANTIRALGTFNGLLFAGASSTSGATVGRIFVSTDGGETWELLVTNMLASAVVYDFVSSNGQFYAATLGDGVWRMGDSPYKWEKLGTTGLTNQRVYTLATSGNNLFAGTDGGGVFVSRDSGNSWTAANVGLAFLRIRALAVDGSKLYAGTAFGSAATNEVSVSEDNGLTWKRLGNGIAADFPAGSPNRVYELVPLGGKLFAAGTSGVLAFDGSKWNAVHTGSPTASFYAVTSSGNTLFAGAWYDGIARSTDGGVMWTNLGNGLSNRWTLAVHKDNGVLYAGMTDSVFISRDEGQTWSRTNAPTAAYYTFLSFENKVYAAGSNGVYATDNQGQTWTRLNTGLGTGIIFRIIGAGNLLYCGVLGRGVYRSADGGQNWTTVNTGLTSTQIFDLTANGTTLFAAVSTAGVFRSTDEGQNWTAVNAGLPAGPAYSVAALNNTVVVAIGGQTIYRSTDNGQTWTAPQTGFIASGTDWWMDSRGGNLYASTDDAHGVLRSTDEGRSWQLINMGFDSRWATNFFVSGATLYAATPNGVYVSNSLVNRASTVSAASFSALAIVEKSIVTAFGPSLATRTDSAGSLPLPTNLGGTTVKVRDSLGVERLAPLFFVSAEQVNYQIPAGTAAGPTRITITNSDGISATGDLNIVARAPAIFTISANGSGPAAAVDALTGAAAPFNATQSNGQPNIISVFGTGLGADATDLDANVNTSVTATIGGRAATVQYAGHAPGYVGTNQFNITLPAGLTTGNHPLIVTRGGASSNSVTIAIK